MRLPALALFAALAASNALAQTTVTFLPKHEELTYTFGGNAPVKHVAPGARIVASTEDCYDGALKTPADLPSKAMPPGHDNPQTGPFYVDGAEPGDVLAVKILRLAPARDHGISATFPGFGALNPTDKTAMLGVGVDERVWWYSVDVGAGMVRTKSLDGKQSWEVPLAPFLGCLGVAPGASEVRSTVVPGDFGGNMDCPEVKAGNTVYLPVRVPGGMLSFGDGHYAMGDGEITGTAVEGAMDVELVVDLVKKKALAWPRIENAEWIMTIGAARPLEDAARVAFKSMVEWVRELTGLSELDAYQFVSQAARAPIVQMVDPEYTVLVKVEKKRLPKKG
jgi:acetamidase/formamidase